MFKIVISFTVFKLWLVALAVWMAYSAAGFFVATIYWYVYRK
ncbi:hypothetical protein O163_11815 [Caldanaerobacter subterraneus subsp. yonseiensis KB-1]|uniref:Uncharacterized protein n=1 Tax=Caldanaerobacter subterraneus subsp. yonseiensis KB-1 TaxID=1388761 RepID=U5CE46_CALSX|nr:hypothetical protein [Caldanaerobacter subterraneus]ERM91200.1 hypothetical protein O163_11815 [Caldanaerobacter subterraneus subsp. yonseiensis KB-1]